jgi:hypothetical protein
MYRYTLSDDPVRRIAIIGIMAIVGAILASYALTMHGTIEPALPSDDTPFAFSFNTDGVLEEAGTPEESSSPFWWLNSGGRLIITDLHGETLRGIASPLDIWRIRYALTNPTDTDNGSRPQNIFRLVTRARWHDARISARFSIVGDDFSNSANRNSSNGILLMSRYRDAGQTLYYAGLRVDGTAIIKKKYHGTYYTLAQQKIFPGEYAGDRDDVNLIPHDEWIALESESSTQTDGSVTIALSIRRVGQEHWTTLITATDRGQYGGTPPLGIGFAGIRTDFMDARFDSFRIDLP